VTVTFATMALLAYLLSSNHAGLLPLLLDILFLGLLGPSVEDVLGRVSFCVLCIVGGLLALAARTLAGADSPSPALFGVSGTTAAVLGGYVVLHPRARVLTLVALPFFTTMVEIPALPLIGLWLALQVGFGMGGLG
jgi:membrane associated rhomboid family serine protease